MRSRSNDPKIIRDLLYTLTKTGQISTEKVVCTKKIPPKPFNLIHQIDVNKWK